MISAALGFTLLKVVVILGVLLTLVAYAVWFDRMLLARMQSRWSAAPARSPGLLQTLADAVKLLVKEDIIPSGASRLLYLLAPALAVIAALLAFAVIPFGPSVRTAGGELFQIADLDIGLLFFLAVTSMGVYGIVMGGWASNSTFSSLGCLRGSAQWLNCVLVIGLALVGVLLMSGSLSLRSIVESQGSTWWGFLPRWNIFPQFVAFVCYFFAALVQTHRPPFDLPKAESELGGGYRGEYSGTKYAMFVLADYANLLSVSCLTVVLFLGGWHGPRFGPDWLQLTLPLLWFFLKVWCFLFFCIWFRGILPRFRYDQLMTFGWKILAPLAMLNVVGTSLYIAVKYR